MSFAWTPALDREIDSNFDELVTLRRHLHAHPELSGEENNTSLHLYQLLGDAGLTVRLGLDGRGVIADCLDASTVAGRGIFALRADLDALRIHDQKQVAYRSQCPGVMHACGHDVHTTVVAGALTALRELHRQRLLPWSVNVRGVFQPAEETCQGAREMIQMGALDGVEAIAAVHVDPTRPVGHLGFRQGVLTASCDDMRITIRGRGGHAARPHESNDPIMGAAQLIHSLYLHIPRATDSQDAVVITIGQIHGGDNANVIPEQVELHGTVRTLDRDVRSKTIQHIHRLAAGVAQTTETHIDVNFGTGSPPISNSASVVQVLKQAALPVVGRQGLDEILRPSMGSEDFAYYLEHVPGALIRLGCASAKIGSAGLHTPLFDVDEEAIRIGAKLLASAAISWFDPARVQQHPATPAPSQVDLPAS